MKTITEETEASRALIDLVLDETATSARHEVRETIDIVRRAMRPVTRTVGVNEDGRATTHLVTRQGLGPLETDHGLFWEYKFNVEDEWCEYTALVRAPLDNETLNPSFSNPERILLRIDSACETGQLFDDLTCDCRDQLKQAMASVERAGEGIIICIPNQDGRGHGLTFKLGTLWLQRALGMNTVEAAALLNDGKPIDVRTYAGVVAVLKALGIGTNHGLALMSNNPAKCSILRENGYVIETVPHVIEPTEHTRHHLVAKGRCLGHTNLVTAHGDIAE